MNESSEQRNMLIAMPSPKVLASFFSAIVIALGGTGGVQALSTLSEIAQKTSETAAAVKDLNDRITTMDKGMLSVKSDIESLKAANNQKLIIDTDQEQRLRKLEKR